MLLDCMCWGRICVAWQRQCCVCDGALSHRVFTCCRPTQRPAAGVLKAHGALFSTQAIFALWYVVGHAVLSDNDPLTFALAREFLSAATLLTLAQVLEGDLQIKDKRDLLDIGVLVRSQHCCCCEH